jgi:hypothetical protein
MIVTGQSSFVQYLCEFYGLICTLWIFDFALPLFLPSVPDEYKVVTINRSSPTQPSPTCARMIIFLCVLTCLIIYFRRSIYPVITPQGIPGIPKLPNSFPILGDIVRIKKHLYKTGSLVSFLDQTIAELGVIYQLVLGPAGL